LLVDRHFLRPEELAQLVAVAPPLKQEPVVGGEFLDAVVLAILGDIEIALRVLSGIGDEMELARPRPPRAAERPVGPTPSGA
jgi:hypothetical protein